MIGLVFISSLHERPARNILALKIDPQENRSFHWGDILFVIGTKTVLANIQKICSTIIQLRNKGLPEKEMHVWVIRDRSLHKIVILSFM